MRTNIKNKIIQLKLISLLGNLIKSIIKIIFLLTVISSRGAGSRAVVASVGRNVG